MQTLRLSQTELLTQQGAAALQANDKARAYDLLGRAVQLAPHNEQAWLWLSGAVEAAAERRYCLERVLVINPHNAAAQRGLTLLPPTMPVSPFSEEAPPEPAATEPAPAPIEASTTGLTLAAPALAPITQAASLLDIVAQPDPLATPMIAGASLGSMGIADLAVVTYMPPPIVAPPTAPPAAPGSHDQALAEFVVGEFGRYRSRDEIIRALSEQHQLAWGEAQDLVARVAREQRRSIAARQSPFLIGLGIVTIIGGCILVGRGIFVLHYLYSDPSLVRTLSPRAVGITVGQMGLGVMMVLGALIGLGQTIKGLFK